VREARTGERSGGGAGFATINGPFAHSSHSNSKLEQTRTGSRERANAVMAVLALPRQSSFLLMTNQTSAPNPASMHGENQ